MPPPPTTSTLFPYTTLFRSQLGRNRNPRFILAILPRIRVIRHHRRHPPSRSALECINHQQQFDQMMIDAFKRASRSEEHTSELQSLRHLVCRLLLEKKK